MSTKAQVDQAGTGQSGRLEFVDVARGLAVVLMIWMHTADGWLLPSLRSGQIWALIRAIGGMAAPMFLLLAGLGSPMTAQTQKPVIEVYKSPG